MATFDYYQTFEHQQQQQQHHSDAFRPERSTDFLPQPDLFARDDFFQIEDYLHCDNTSPQLVAGSKLLDQPSALTPAAELHLPEFDFDFNLSTDDGANDGANDGAAGIHETSDREINTQHVDGIESIRCKETVPAESYPLKTLENLKVPKPQPVKVNSAFIEHNPGIQKHLDSPQRPIEVKPQRKNRFASAINTLRGKSPRKQDNTMDQASTLQGKDHIASFQEWTQRFGQISLQQGSLNGTPALSPGRDIREKPVLVPQQPGFEAPPRPMLGHRKTLSEHIGTKHHGLGIHVPPPSINLSPGHQGFHQFPASAGPLQQEFPSNAFPIPSPDHAAARLRQTASWSQPPQNLLQHDFTVSPGELQTTWEDPLQQDSYFTPGGASLPTPDYSNPDYSMSYTAYGQYPDGSPDFPLIMQQPSPQMQQLYQMKPSQMFVARPQTPQSRPVSVTPPPALPPAPRLDNPPAPGTIRSHKRRSAAQLGSNKVGTLRAPKSAGNLRSPTKVGSGSIARDLRSPKSASSLKHAKSSGALRSSPTKSNANGANGAAGGFGFVNFTPMDSSRILTGVAPSGSSKTKARREMEAADRKRRLSMAAEKAIRDAGGNVEELRKEGLL